eukprot:UN04290
MDIGEQQTEVCPYDGTFTITCEPDMTLKVVDSCTSITGCADTEGWNIGIVAGIYDFSEFGCKEHEEEGICKDGQFVETKEWSGKIGKI